MNSCLHLYNILKTITFQYLFFIFLQYSKNYSIILQMNKIKNIIEASQDPNIHLVIHMDPICVISDEIKEIWTM